MTVTFLIYRYESLYVDLPLHILTSLQINTGIITLLFIINRNILLHWNFWFLKLIAVLGFVILFLDRTFQYH